MKIFGSITELLNLVLRKDTRAITVRPNQTVTYTADRDVQLPPQDVDAVLVSETATQTLTNKTVDGDNNTVQDLPVTAIKTVLADANKVLLRDASGVVTSALVGDSNLATGIDAAKIDGGLVSNVEFNYLDGVTSAIQTQLDAKVDENAAIVGATNTKITYDSKGLVTSGTALAASDLPTGIDATKLADGSVTSTEFQYINTVTSNVQTQLDAKALKGANSDITSLSGLTTALSIGQGGTGQTTAQTARNALLPSQTSNTNRFLRTDGTDVSWASTGGGVGKNYLQDQYDADTAISVQQSVTNAIGTYTRLNPTSFGSSSAVSNLISVSADTSLRPTNNYLIAFASNGQFIETPLFSLDGIDLGKAMAVSFAVTGVGAADDVQTYIARYDSGNILRENIPIAGIASATSPNSAQVPTGTTTFRGFFLPSSTAGDKYALRILRNATNVSMRIDALVVGPNSVMTGTAITDWISYTPTTTGLTTTSVLGKYRRVGDSINVVIKVVATASSAKATFSLPSGLSIDTTKQNDSTTAYHQDILGVSSLYLVTPNIWNTGTVRYNSATTVQCFQIADGANTLRQDYWGNATPASWATGGTLELQFTVPVIGWSSNVTMADRAVEEYASNGGAAGVATSDYADFKFGSSGSQIGSISASIDRRVRFQTPILATDSLIFEVSTDRLIWFPLNNNQVVNGSAISTILNQSGIRYGAGRFEQVSNTDVNVSFGQYAQNAGAYGAIGSTWASACGAGYWRVRKVSGGAAVGYPIGARNVIGDTTGTAVPAGYIGEILTGTIANSGSAYTTNTLKNVNSISLTAGTWLVYTYPIITVGTTLGANSYIVQSISSSAVAHQSEVRSAATLSADNYVNPAIKYVNLSSATTYYLNVTVNFPSGTCTNAALTLMYAVRIA